MRESYGLQTSNSVVNIFAKFASKFYFQNGANAKRCANCIFPKQRCESCGAVLHEKERISANISIFSIQTMLSRFNGHARVFDQLEMSNNNGHSPHRISYLNMPRMKAY